MAEQHRSLAPASGGLDTPLQPEQSPPPYQTSGPTDGMTDALRQLDPFPVDTSPLSSGARPMSHSLGPSRMAPAVALNHDDSAAPRPSHHSGTQSSRRTEQKV
jgi:hypothetical protein